MKFDKKLMDEIAKPMKRMQEAAASESVTILWSGWVHGKLMVIYQDAEGNTYLYVH